MSNVIPRQLDAASAAIRTDALVRRYRRVTALNGVSITVPENSFTLLVGPNGAGKSTLLKVLMDIERADSGSAYVCGIDTRYALARAGVGYMSERHDEQYGWMRVRQLLAHHSAYYPSWDASYAAKLLADFDVPVEARLRNLSKGQVRRVQLVLSLAHRPPVLLLDEPTDGLDPFARDVFFSLLADHLAVSPATVLVSTHLVYEMERMADHMTVLNGGAITAQASCELLRSSMHSYIVAGEPVLEPHVLGDRLLHRNGDSRNARLVVWGSDRDVAERLSAAGANVRDVSPLSLEETARMLVARKS